MTTSYQKKLKIEKADKTTPETKNWKLTLPKVNSKDAFIVDFPQILDYNSLKQRLIVTDNTNIPVPGVISVKNQETQWHFKPEASWKKGSYFLYINTRLEDPSGNNLNGLFDHKIGSLKYDKEGKTLNIPFTIQ